MIEVTLWFGVALLCTVTYKILHTFHLDLDYDGYREDINKWIKERFG